MARAAPIKDVSDPRWVRAISHPIRIRVLGILENEPCSPKVLSERLRLPLGTIAYHVRTLNQLGLLELVETFQRRGATEHYYRAVRSPRFSDGAWAELDVVSKQRVLSAMLGEANRRATAAAAAGGFDAEDAHFTRTPLRLDRQGWTKLAAASKRWLDEAAAIQAEAEQRLDAAGEPGADDAIDAIAAQMVVLLFESPVDVAPASDTSEHKPSRRGRKPATR